MLSPIQRATIPSTPLKQGMISPSVPFVQPDGTLTPLSFRFLFKLWNALSDDVASAPLERERMDALEARIAALEARP